MNKKRSPEQLKEALAELLEEKKLDYGKILALSVELAASDHTRVRFTADSGLISRLGKEAVARQETAVSELVKNAYDADAKRVKVTFTNSQYQGGTLLLEDDGVGMTRDQLVNGFMRIASTEKVHEPQSPKFKRHRAGRKGIGRFAAQRLGKQLELTTQTTSSGAALQLSIDWGHFEKETDLFLIPSRIRELPKTRKEGTTLRILGLREGWTDSEISRVYRYISELTQPFPISKQVKTKGRKLKDPGFKAIFFRKSGAHKTEIASEDRMVFDYALAQVTGKVNSEGRGEWTVTSKRYGLSEKHAISPSKDNSKESFNCLRDVNFKAYYFIWASDLIPGQQLTRLRNLGSEQGGIRLYRNGFRVLPYGESQDDWLGLNEQYRKRTVLYPLANNNWLGFVEIIDPEGIQFEETSSREGLARNQSFNELTQFVSTALIAAASRVNSAREVKLTAGEKDFKSKRLRMPTESLSQTASELEETARKLEMDGAGTRSVGSVRRAAAGIRRAEQVLVQENAMLRVLSSLGLTIGIFTHEIRHQLLDLLHQIREWAEGHSPEKAIKAALPQLESRLLLLQSYTAYFDAAVSANVHRELKPQDISATIFEFVAQFEPVALRAGCKFLDIDIEEGLTSIPMHPSEWASILGNLLTNATKSVSRSHNRSRGKISISARKENKILVVDFSDNGEGIPIKIRERIFEPFFTTTTTAHSKDDLTGTGLGLKIVRDIVSSYGGEIYVAKASPEYATCMRIEIPALEQ